MATIAHFGNLECFSHVLHGPYIKTDFPSSVPRWDTGGSETKRLSSFTKEPFKAGLVDLRNIFKYSTYAKYTKLDRLPLFNVHEESISFYRFIIHMIRLRTCSQTSFQ